MSDGPRQKLVDVRAVSEAARTGQALDATGAIVTPAARDLARQLGVSLDMSVAGAPAAPSTDPAAAGANLSPLTNQCIALGADHGGFRLKESLKPLIESLGFHVDDLGCHSADPVDYPVFAARVAEAVALGHASYGIMVDGAGIGSAMVANKIRGVRAALCYDLSTARNAREHNNANVLTLGGALIGEKLAADIVRTFLATPFAGGRHLPRVAMIDALDS